MTDEVMTPEKKLAVIREQIKLVQDGKADHIQCPYCGGLNYPTNEFLCCGLFDTASHAVMDRMQIDLLRDFKGEVEERSLLVN